MGTGSNGRGIRCNVPGCRVRFRRSFLVGAALLAGGGLAACGARSLLTLPEPAGSGGHGGAGSMLDGGPPDVSVEASAEAGHDAAPDAGPDAGPDAAPEAGAGGGPSCLPDAKGNLCAGPGDCCSGTCNMENYCGPLICQPEGDPCLDDSECCEMNCRQSDIIKRCLNCLDGSSPAASRASCAASGAA